MSTGMIWPRWFSVAALYALQKSMMLMPWGPNAVPTGGAGVAPPAWIWIFTTAASFFFAIVSSAPFAANAVSASLVASRVADSFLISLVVAAHSNGSRPLAQLYALRKLRARVRQARVLALTRAPG